MNGIEGVGYHTRVSSNSQYIVPIIENMTSQQVILAHNYDFDSSETMQSTLKYNATFVFSTEDYSLTTLSLGDSSPGIVGTVSSGIGNPYPTVSLPTCTTGILIVTYQQAGSSQGGVVMMPWGINSLAFPVTFGGNPEGQNWVSTESRSNNRRNRLPSKNLVMESRWIGDWLNDSYNRSIICHYNNHGRIHWSSLLCGSPGPSQVAPINLNRLSLTTLQMLDSQDDLSKAAFDTANSTLWGQLQVALAASLPSNVVYNLTVYNVNDARRSTLH